MLSISMARCVIAQRIPTVGIWRYVVDVPGSVNRNGVGSLYIKQTPCTVVERRAPDICLHMFVCMRERVVPDMEFPRWEFLSVEGFAVVSGNCLFRPSVRSGAAVHASINQHYYHPLRRRLFASLAPSSPVPHTHMLSECCLTFSEGLSLLIPSTRPCRGSRSGIFRT